VIGSKIKKNSLKKNEHRQAKVLSSAFIVLFFALFSLACACGNFSLNSFTTTLSKFLCSKAEASEQTFNGKWIKVVKHEFKLYVYNNDKVIKSYNVAVGRNLGQKQRAGDNRTPEGNFTVQQIQRSDYWSHDFRDGKGVIEKAYGPWFIRLKTGWKGIGIHGTHAPSSIGKNDTEGCIRLRNEELVELKNNHIKIDMPVVIVK